MNKSIIRKTNPKGMRGVQIDQRRSHACCVKGVNSGTITSAAPLPVMDIDLECDKLNLKYVSPTTMVTFVQNIDVPYVPYLCHRFLITPIHL